MLSMVKKIGIVCCMLWIGWGKLAIGDDAPQEFQLLVLSELEERIAGQMAFNALEKTFSERGYQLTEDAKITEIGRAVAKYSDRPQLSYVFYVIDGNIAPQALSLPGGYVFVSRSLLEGFCQNDAEIAFVLGHEIAHSALRHYADYKLRGDQKVAYIKNLIQQHELVSEIEGQKYAEELQEILAPYIMNIRRVKEMEADQFGSLYALRSGYEFAGGIHMLQRLLNAYGEQFQLESSADSKTEESPSDAATHPKISQRIEQLELFRLKAIEVSKLFPLGREALDDNKYQKASFIFETILSLFPQSRSARIGLGVAYHLRYWNSSPEDGFLLAYPGAMELEQLQLLRPGKPDMHMLQRAIEQYRLVLAEEPGNLYAINNIGVALAELNQQDDAEKSLRESLRVGQKDFILFNLALVLRQKYSEKKQPEIKEEAVVLLRQYLQFAPHDQLAKQYLEELEHVAGE